MHACIRRGARAPPPIPSRDSRISSITPHIPPHDTPRRSHPSQVYVQHLVESEAQALWPLMAGGGHVYVCGATKMGTDVHAAFERVAVLAGGKTPAAAAVYVKELKAAGRYVQELWSS